MCMCVCVCRCCACLQYLPHHECRSALPGGALCGRQWVLPEPTQRHPQCRNLLRLRRLVCTVCVCVCVCGCVCVFGVEVHCTCLHKIGPAFRAGRCSSIKDTSFTCWSYCRAAIRPTGVTGIHVIQVWSEYHIPLSCCSVLLFFGLLLRKKTRWLLIKN